MQKLRFAYYLIADAPDFRALRDGTCDPFPEHVTIRGRFLANRSALADLVVAGREAFRMLAPFTVEFIGPRVVDDRLAWYEPSDDSRAAPALRAVHRHLDRDLAKRGVIAFDEVPESHRGESYTPHMTVAFRALSAVRLRAMPRSMPVAFNEWGLFVYDDEWQPRPRLRCAFGEHLYSTQQARSQQAPSLTADANALGSR